MGVNRVLIVDWDIHAGQGTQYCIEGDEGIRLISIHCYLSISSVPINPTIQALSRALSGPNCPRVLLCSRVCFFALQSSIPIYCLRRQHHKCAAELSWKRRR